MSSNNEVPESTPEPTVSGQERSDSVRAPQSSDYDSPEPEAEKEDLFPPLLLPSPAPGDEKFSPAHGEEKVSEDLPEEVQPTSFSLTPGARVSARPTKELSSVDTSSAAEISAAAAAGAAVGVGIRDTHVGSAPSQQPGIYNTNTGSMASGVVAANTVTSEVTDSTHPSRGPTNASVVTIDHTIKSSSSGGGALSLFFTLQKPLLGLLVALLLAGSVGWFVTQFSTIPGLNDQIDELDATVDVLGEEVDRLEVEVNQLEEANEELKHENDRLENQTKILVEEVNDLEDQVDRQQQLIQNLTIEVFELTYQVDQLENETATLNATIAELESEVDQLEYNNEVLYNQTIILNNSIEELEEINENLTQINEMLEAENANLTQEVEELQDVNHELNATVVNLTAEVAALEEEIDRLTELNKALIEVITFLNETFGFLNQTFQEIVDYLDEEIAKNCEFVMQSQENIYTQTVLNWNCDFSDFFYGKDFLLNTSIPIGADDYPAVMDYVETRVLSPLCLNTTDFELYLANEIVGDGVMPPVDVSVDQLFTGVGDYSGFALDYYFNDTEDGLTKDDWMEAEWDCNNLPSNLTYRFY